MVRKYMHVMYNASWIYESNTHASYVHRSGPRVIVMLVIARIIIAPFNVVCSLGGWTDTKEDGCPSGKPFIPPFYHFDHF